MLPQIKQQKGKRSKLELRSRTRKEGKDITTDLPAVTQTVGQILDPGQEKGGERHKTTNLPAANLPLACVGGRPPCGSHAIRLCCNGGPACSAGRPTTWRPVRPPSHGRGTYMRKGAVGRGRVEASARGQGDVQHGASLGRQSALRRLAAASPLPSAGLCGLNGSLALAPLSSRMGQREGEIEESPW